MKYEDITIAAAKKLLPSVSRIQKFYEQLRIGLERQGFTSSDPFYRRVVDAENRAHDVKIWTFYATVKNGVGVRERKEE